MKKIALAVTMGLSSLVSIEAQAATAEGTFDVNITLTSKCEINSENSATGAVINNLSMAYTSFQTAAATGSASFNVRCTDGLDYGLALDSESVTDDVLGLAYTLSLSAAAATGNGLDQRFAVNGSIAQGQAGACATASCDNALATNKTRTLTVTY